jgi:cystathionine gamma-synthase
VRYADVLQERLGGEVEARYCDPMDGRVPQEAGKPEGDDGAAEPTVPLPALLIGDLCIAPSDGVIVSPEDIAASLADQLPGPDAAELARHLEEALERWMVEWANA